MSEVQPSSTAPAAEPVMTTAQEATTDPVRTNATKDLTPESRPEVIDGTSAAESAGLAGTIEETPKGVAVIESQPINEGVLAYKQPGLVKSLMYSKKFFWLSDEPVEHRHLTDYLRGEKTIDIARPNAAHASQTGKGLLFFAKRAEDKPQPQGIINLADIKDVSKTGPTEFTFKYHSHKHAFQAGSTAERDGWLVTLETRHAEAKSDRDGVIGSAGYKSSLEKFFGAATSTSRSLSRHKKTQDIETADTTSSPVAAGVGGDSASSSDEAKTSNAKSRSQSRKRGSMFGALLGKKEQHDEKKELKKEEKEEKKEEKAEDKAVKAEVKKEEKAEKQAEKEERKEEKVLAKEEKKAPKSDGVVEPKPLDAAAVASRVMENPVVPVEGTKTEESTVAGNATAESTAPATAPETPAITTSRETAPKANKRNSIFGGFFGKKETPATTTPTANTTAHEPAPAVPAKDTEQAPISQAAPQAENQATETTPSVDTAATTQNAPTTTSTASPVSPDATKANRRSSFFSNLGTKKEKRTGAVSDAEGTDGEGKKSGGFGGLLRKASRAQGPKSASKPTPATEGAADTEAPASTSKDVAVAEPTTTNSTTNSGTIPGNVVPESTIATSQPTPVQATA
ncbi:MAG: hypothetical protein Q9166_000377 [cf. Caloplaca sp. 2 TL-2023]